MSSTKIKIFAIFIITGVIFFGIYLYFKKSSRNSSNGLTQKNIPVQSSDTLQYKNLERGFTFDYPKGLNIKDNDEGDTTHTIVFSDESGERSFQVFFTPYYGNQITQSRILKDIPSGKFTEPIEILINGNIRALAFFSTIESDEMREVWFLYDGYLYEVTAYKDLDEWLAKIVETWQFFQANPAGGR